MAAVARPTFVGTALRGRPQGCELWACNWFRVTHSGPHKLSERGNCNSVGRVGLCPGLSSRGTYVPSRCVRSACPRTHEGQSHILVRLFRRSPQPAAIASVRLSECGPQSNQAVRISSPCAGSSHSTASASRSPTICKTLDPSHPLLRSNYLTVGKIGATVAQD